MKTLLIAVAIFSGCNCQRNCPVAKIVASIGGCNRYGQCSVRYEDGYVERYVNQPVVGERRTVYAPCEAKP